jgi:hypothetical protein
VLENKAKNSSRQGYFDMTGGRFGARRSLFAARPSWSATSSIAKSSGSINTGQARANRFSPQDQGVRLAGGKLRQMGFRILQGLLPLRPREALKDALAGLTLASMNVPQVLGYTRIAGTPVVTGLYTVLLPLVGFALFGSSGIWWSRRIPRLRDLFQRTVAHGARRQ